MGGVFGPGPFTLTEGRRIVAVTEITGQEEGQPPGYKLVLVEVRVDVPGEPESHGTSNLEDLEGEEVIRPASAGLLQGSSSPLPVVPMAVWQRQIEDAYREHRETRLKEGRPTWPPHPGAGGRDDAIVLSPRTDEVVWVNGATFPVFVEIMRDPDIISQGSESSPFAWSGRQVIPVGQAFSSGPIGSLGEQAYFKARAWFAGGPAVDPHIIVH